MSWKKFAWPALLLLAVLSVLLGVGVGSVFVPPTDVLASLGVHFFGMTAPEGLDEITVIGASTSTWDHSFMEKLPRVHRLIRWA